MTSTIIRFLVRGLIYVIASAIDLADRTKSAREDDHVSVSRTANIINNGAAAAADRFVDGAQDEIKEIETGAEEGIF